MIAYLDTSAATKLVAEETGSAAMQRFVTELEPGELVSSTLLETELRRAFHGAGLTQEKATQVIRRVSLIIPDRDFFHDAGLLPGRRLRSLDALHLVTAIRAQADVVVAYNHRLLDAALAAGLDTLSPS